MQSVEQYTEQVRTLTQQCIETFDRFMDESYDRVNGAIDSIYEQICLKPAPEQIRTKEQIKKKLVQQQKAEVVVQEEQEVFERQEDLLQILSNANQIMIDDDDPSSIFKKLLDMLKKEQIKDCVAYLQQLKNSDKQEKEQIKKIINILKNIKDHEFNLMDYSSEQLEEIKKDLIKKLQGQRA
ncbi:unnamed protein product [Paramecium pentaurelia]|uniref:Uncharacterized protein n=1 Tax=Paramecium pentaurelia TaxID=43138 RepID=A0A8S1SLA8_9CILI|nr:unnamed protein product [Paramecium pentaurelia]